MYERTTVKAAEIDSKLQEIDSSIEKYNLSKDYQNITAPVSGYVNSIAVNTLGVSVTQGQQLITIVPDDMPSEMVCYVKNMDINLILLGGSYQKESQVLVGPLTSQAASSFYVDHYFIGTDGYTDVTGFTGRDFERCMTVREISRHAKNVIVVSESEKFGKQGTVNLLRASEVSAVVTDSSLPLEYETTLTDQGVEIYKAE